MVVKVTRHGITGPDPEGYARLLGDGVADAVQALDRYPQEIDSAMDQALTYLQARCLVDPRASRLESWEAAVTAMQVGSAIFSLAAATEGEVVCRIGHEAHTLPASGPQPHAGPGQWLTSFWLAIVCREQGRMTQLSEVPLDVLRASGAQVDEYVYHWVATLQTYWLERPGLAESLRTTIDMSYPDIARLVDREVLDKIAYQPINMFHRLLLKDREGFNEALAEALDAHKAYWTGAESRANSVQGTIALGPLAIACLALDGGIPIDVESEYLPISLLNRAWLGEFPT